MEERKVVFVEVGRELSGLSGSGSETEVVQGEGVDGWGWWWWQI